MTSPDLDRRELADRRVPVERRGQPDRRVDAVPVPTERRLGLDRRKSPRRSGIERRLALQSAAAQMQTALALLTRIAESGVLSDDHLRLLDAAMLRLRFAVERMEQE